MKGKRLLVILLALVLAFTSFTACGLFGKDKDKDKDKNTEQTSNKDDGKDKLESVTLTDKALGGDLLIDFAKGADPSVVFESDGWTNGDVFNVVWAKHNVKYENGKMLLDIKKENIVACGDGFNDLSMIKYAHVGVCMANGCNECKEAADFIAPSNDEDGICAVVEKYFEI